MKRRLDPEWPLDVIRALRFREGSDDGLRRLAAADWKSLLAATDRDHITLALAVRCRSVFPSEAQTYLDGALQRNAARYGRLCSAYQEIAEALSAGGIEFHVLKGFAQWPWYMDDPRHRYQSDLDLYCRPEFLKRAAEALSGLGYEPHRNDASGCSDHLPLMIRRTGWTWEGDYYDPNRPPYVEVHFRFWDAETEGFAAGDAEGFAARSEIREVDGMPLPTLSVIDGLRYSAMHLVRHLLRGDLHVRHVYELAHFLERSADDRAFWEGWRNTGDQAPRLVEAIAFRLAAEWFHCRLHPVARRTMEQMPAGAERWFRLFAFSPALNTTKPNKDELWLHLCLVEDPLVRRRIAVRRVLPKKRARVVMDAQTPKGEGGALLCIRRILYEADFLSRRAWHHARTLLPLLRSGMRWRRATAAFE